MAFFAKSLTEAAPINLDFQAVSIQIENPTSKTVYVNVGSNSSPQPNACSLTVPPYTYMGRSIVASTRFAFDLSIPTGTGASSLSNPTVRFYDTPQSEYTNSINQPGVLVKPNWITVIGNVDNTPLNWQQVLPPIPGKKLQIFKIMGARIWVVPPIVQSAVYIAFWDGVTLNNGLLQPAAADLMYTLYIDTTDKTAENFSPIDFNPYSADSRLNGQGLYVAMSPSTTPPDAGILYSWIPLYGYI